MQNDNLFWVWLSEALGAASKDFRQLISLYESPYEIFHLDADELDRVECISPKARESLGNKDLKAATDILASCEEKGIGILPYGDERYPKVLRDITDPPVLLYYVGNLPSFEGRLAIAMVGTRSMSAYGLQSAYRISYELAGTGVIIVSGMAAGIDGVSAAGAIEAEGETVAVLGCGVDILYPKHHDKLRENILSHGAIFSEYPPGTRPDFYRFPIRNRIISALSQGTVVVEAGLGSGSLITAKTAILQGRDVYAVPANVGSRGAEGTNGLLRDGANLVLETKDILDRYQYVYANAFHPEKLPEVAKHSKPDLKKLSALGVIELIPTVAGAKPPEKRVAPSGGTFTPVAAKPTSEKKTTEKAASPASTEKAPERRAEPAKREPKEAAKTPDAILQSLSPVQLEILKAIPDDKPMTVDGLVKLGLPYGEVIAGLTMLEIMGVVKKLPGAFYSKS